MPTCCAPSSVRSRLRLPTTPLLKARARLTGLEALAKGLSMSNRTTRPSGNPLAIFFAEDGGAILVRLLSRLDGRAA